MLAPHGQLLDAPLLCDYIMKPFPDFVAEQTQCHRLQRQR